MAVPSRSSVASPFREKLRFFVPEDYLFVVYTSSIPKRMRHIRRRFAGPPFTPEIRFKFVLRTDSSTSWSLVVGRWSLELLKVLSISSGHSQAPKDLLLILRCSASPHAIHRLLSCHPHNSASHAYSHARVHSRHRRRRRLPDTLTPSLHPPLSRSLSVITTAITALPLPLIRSSSHRPCTDPASAVAVPAIRLLILMHLAHLVLACRTPLFAFTSCRRLTSLSFLP
jgi:hypothetical protein